MFGTDVVGRVQGPCCETCEGLQRERIIMHGAITYTSHERGDR